MAVIDDLHPGIFITKIATYEWVIDVTNSNTILHKFLPLSSKYLLS
jgi:hypothetical protein